MRAKAYVLGAVLGTAPGLLSGGAALWRSPAPLRSEGPRGGASLPADSDLGGSGAQPLVPAEVDLAVPKHPCELITVMQVPCDASASTCEYTYWQCPRSVKPLRA